MARPAAPQDIYEQMLNLINPYSWIRGIVWHNLEEDFTYHLTARYQHYGAENAILTSSDVGDFPGFGETGVSVNPMDYWRKGVLAQVGSDLRKVLQAGLGKEDLVVTSEWKDAWSPLLTKDANPAANKFGIVEKVQDTLADGRQIERIKGWGATGEEQSSRRNLYDALEGWHNIKLVKALRDTNWQSVMEASVEATYATAQRLSNEGKLSNTEFKQFETVYKDYKASQTTKNNAPKTFNPRKVGPDTDLSTSFFGDELQKQAQSLEASQQYTLDLQKTYSHILSSDILSRDDDGLRLLNSLKLQSANEDYYAWLDFWQKFDSGEIIRQYFWLGDAVLDTARNLNKMGIKINPKTLGKIGKIQSRLAYLNPGFWLQIGLRKTNYMGLIGTGYGFLKLENYDFVTFKEGRFPLAGLGGWGRKFTAGEVKGLLWNESGSKSIMDIIDTVDDPSFIKNSPDILKQLGEGLVDPDNLENVLNSTGIWTRIEWSKLGIDPSRDPAAPRQLLLNAIQNYKNSTGHQTLLNLAAEGRISRQEVYEFAEALKAAGLGVRTQGFLGILFKYPARIHFFIRFNMRRVAERAGLGPLYGGWAKAMQGFIVRRLGWVFGAWAGPVGAAVSAAITYFGFKALSNFWARLRGKRTTPIVSDNIKKIVFSVLACGCFIAAAPSLVIFYMLSPIGGSYADFGGVYEPIHPLEAEPETTVIIEVTHNAGNLTEIPDDPQERTARFRVRVRNTGDDNVTNLAISHNSYSEPEYWAGSGFEGFINNNMPFNLPHTLGTDIALGPRETQHIADIELPFIYGVRHNEQARYVIAAFRASYDIEEARSETAQSNGVILIGEAIEPCGLPMDVSRTDVSITQRFNVPITYENYAGGRHSGVDIAEHGRLGAPMVSTISGILFNCPSFEEGKSTCNIYESQNHPWNYVVVSNGTWSILYGHVHERARGGFTKPHNSLVQLGDVIALQGTTGYSTGPHVHYMVWRGGFDSSGNITLQGIGDAFWRSYHSHQLVDGLDFRHCGGAIPPGDGR